MSNTSVRAAAEGMPKVNRRAMLAGTAATAAALAASTLPARAESPIMKLFREWDALYQAGYSASGDDEADQLADAMMALEKQMMAMPAVTARDFAAKLIAATGYGDFTLSDDDGGSPVLAEAKSLVGGQRS